MRINKIILALLLTLLMCAQTAGAAPVDLEKIYGPRIDKLCMVIITNEDARIMAIEAGKLDIVSDLARPADIERLARNPSVEMSLARAYHAFFIMINNKTEPWKDAAVRRAAAQSVNRNNIVRTIFSGYCEPINSWLPPVSPWALPDTGHNRYDPEAARKLLKEAGYTWNLAGHLVAPDGKPLEKIKLITPLARVAATTNEVAERIADSLAAVGFPVEVEPMDFTVLSSRLERKDYSLSVIAWSLSRSPLPLYSFFHSSADVDGGYNQTGTMDTELDKTLDALKSAKTKEDAALAAAHAQQLLTGLVPTVPIYSRFSISAVSKQWKNVLSTPAMTADNIWTVLTAEPVDGKRRILNMALAEEPRNLNPIVTSSAYSWQVLSYIYETLLGTDPWTQEDRPSLARAWLVRTENAKGVPRTVLEFDLRDDIFWNDGEKFTAADVKATIDFLTKNKPPRYFDHVKGVESVETDGKYRVIVRMHGVSYWQLDEIGGIPCLPAHVLEKIKDWQTWNPMDKSGKSGPYGLVGTGPFMFEEYRDGEYLMMAKNPHFRLLRNKKEEGEVWGK